MFEWADILLLLAGAFLAGIVHDVGKLIFVDHRPDDYTALLHEKPPRQTIDAEEEYFGITSLNFQII